jgi:hypothetical protein
MARIVSKHQHTEQDPEGQGSEWHFTVTNPPIGIVEKIDELVGEYMEEKQKLAFTVFSKNEELKRQAVDLTSDSTSISGNEKLQAYFTKHADAPMILELLKDPPLGVQKQCAAIVLEYCSEPENLLDESGSCITWKVLSELDAAYYTKVLYRAALGVYNRARGDGLAAERKN